MKRRQNNQGNNIQPQRTCSQATQGSTTTQPNFNIDKESSTKIMICMMHDHLINIANPGTYAIELYKMMKANGLPNTIIPENPPYKRIYNMQGHPTKPPDTRTISQCKTNQATRVTRWTESTQSR